MGTVIAQTTNVPVDSQESSNPTKVLDKRTDPSSMTAGHTANTPMAGSEATPMADGNDTSKPMHKKHRNHRKSGSAVPGGMNGVGDMSHPGVQADGNDTAVMTGNSYPGNPKQGQ